MDRNPRRWAHNPNEENAPLTDRGQAYPACGRGRSAVAVSSAFLHGDTDDDPTLRLLRQAFRTPPSSSRPSLLLVARLPACPPSFPRENGASWVVEITPVAVTCPRKMDVSREDLIDAASICP